MKSPCLILKKMPKLKRRLLLAVLLLLAASSASWLAIFLIHFSSQATHFLNNNHSNLGLPPPPPPPQILPSADSGPYHNFPLFAADFDDMIHSFKIYIYPTNSDPSASPSSSSFSFFASFASIFLPHPNPLNPKLGNYFSEHMFKLSLLSSSLITPKPEKAHLFFLPFSINLLRNDPRVHSEPSIAEFVARYVSFIGQDLPYWNASDGTDHFYACCHSVCREAASRHRGLRNNAVQLTCSSSYFQRFYVAHKDVSLPQVWPRPPQESLNPPHARDKLVYFSGRIQNSNIRQQLTELWGNDTIMDIFPGNPSYPYEEGFKRSKFCLHVKGYEVNTARVSDAVHYGCIPVIISNHYELPFANVLDWSKFSVIVNNGEVALLKRTLLSITTESYMSMYQNLCKVRRHFVWHETPEGYDSFHMTAYQLWQRRSSQRLSS